MPSPSDRASVGSLPSLGSAPAFGVKVADSLQRVMDAERALADLRCSLMDLRSTDELSVASPSTRTSDCLQPTLDRLNTNIILDSLVLPVQAQNQKSEEKSKQRVRQGTDEGEVDHVKEGELRKYARLHGYPFPITEQCYRIFQKADLNNSGRIDIKELQSMLNKVHDWEMNEGDIDKVLRLFDRNSDHELDFDEFMHAFGNAPLARLETAIEKIGEETRDQMAGKRMTAEEKVSKYGVKRSVIKEWIAKENRESDSCMQFPAALALFCSFCVMVFMHYPLEQLHAIDKAITYDIMENANFAFSGIVPFENGRMGHKNFDDVNTIADFWSWLNLGLVPLFWPEGWDVSEVRHNVAAKCVSPQAALLGFGGYNESWLQATPQSADIFQVCPEGQASDPVTPPRDWYGYPVMAPTYLYYHSVVGGLRLRQERVKPVDCPSDDIRRSVHRGLCVPDVGHWLRPELQTGLFFNPDRVNLPGGETVYLLSGASQREIRQTLRELENQVWFDPLTVKVEMLHTTYNAHMGVLTAAFLLMVVNPGGHFFKVVEPVSVYVDPYPHWWTLLPDIFWVLLVLKVFFEESYEIIGEVKQSGYVRGLRLYIGVANALDWFCVMYSFAIWIMWALHLVELSRLQGFLSHADVSVQGSWSDESVRISFFDHVEALVREVFIFRWMLAVYPTVIVARFFKAFSAQPRLAMVTQTLYRASTDIVHFGLVFSCIFVIYATSGMILFGQEIFEFANLGRALNTTFRTMLGDFDWDDLSNVGRFQAGVWFWTFSWFVNLVMLNMLLAVIMDVYTEVKGSIGSGAETIWSQTVEIFHRQRGVLAGEYVALARVLEAIEAAEQSAANSCNQRQADSSSAEDVAMQTQDLQAFIPGLSEAQAMEILVSSQEWEETERKPPESLTDATLKIGEVLELVLVMSESLEHLIQMNEMNSNLVISTSRTERAESRSPLPSRPTQDSAINGAMLRLFEDKIRQQIEPVMRQLSDMTKAIESQPAPSSGMVPVDNTRTEQPLAVRFCGGGSRCAPTTCTRFTA